MLGHAKNRGVVGDAIRRPPARPLAVAHALPVAGRVDRLRERQEQIVAHVAEDHLEAVGLERAHRRRLVERLQVKRVQRVEHRLAALEELAFHRLAVQIEVPARRQPAAHRGEKLLRPHRVRQHVIADDQIEAPVERDREVVEVDRTRRRKPVDLFDQEPLVLEDRHRRAGGAVQPPQHRGDRAEPRSDLEHLRRLQRQQRSENLHVHAAREPIVHQRRQVVLAGDPAVPRDEHAVGRHPAQLTPRLVRERGRAERELARSRRADVGPPERFLEALEQPVVAPGRRTTRGVDHAAGMTERVVVDGGCRVGRAIEEDETVVTADACRLGAAADGALLEGEIGLGRTRRIARGVVGQHLLVGRSALRVAGRSGAPSARRWTPRRAAARAHRS